MVPKTGNARWSQRSLATTGPYADLLLAKHRAVDALREAQRRCELFGGELKIGHDLRPFYPSLVLSGRRGASALSACASVASCVSMGAAGALVFNLMTTPGLRPS